MKIIYTKKSTLQPLGFTVDRLKSELADPRVENEKLRAALKLVWDGCQQRGFSPTENETAMVLSALAKEVK